MSLILPRRKFLLSLVGILAAPAIVKLENLMPVKALPRVLTFQYQWLRDGVPIPGETGQTLISRYDWTIPETIEDVMRQSSAAITCNVKAVLA